MEIIKNRLYISGNELDYLGRCPRSVCHLADINEAITCKRCEAFSQILKFMLQKTMNGQNKPSIKIIERQFIKIAKKIKYKTDISTKDKVILFDLLSWCIGNADNINTIGPLPEIHFGLITVQDHIDAIIDDFNNSFTLLKIICDKQHNDHLLHYSTLFKSLWLREEYNLSTNYILIIKPTDEGIKLERQHFSLPTPVIKNSINYILSPISHILQSRNTDNPKSFNTLEPIFGDYCWNCLGCFPKEKLPHDENSK